MFLCWLLESFAGCLRLLSTLIQHLPVPMGTVYLRVYCILVIFQLDHCLILYPLQF